MNKITKNILLVIYLVSLCLMIAGCGSECAKLTDNSAPSATIGNNVTIGTVKTTTSTTVWTSSRNQIVIITFASTTTTLGPAPASTSYSPPTTASPTPTTMIMPSYSTSTSTSTSTTSTSTTSTSSTVVAATSTSSTTYSPTTTTSSTTTIKTIITSSTSTTTTTSTTLGPLHVSGNDIFDSNNNPVVLKGVNMADPYFLDKADGKFNEAFFSTLRDWNVKILRVPVHPGAWIGISNYAQTYLDPIVEWANKYGMYVILDWHAIGNPVSGEEDIQSWEFDSPWTNVYHPVYESNLTYAKSALGAWAARYSSKPWVLYEVFNEPAITGKSYTWAQWKAKAEQLVDVVRANSPQALVLVSGLCWTSDLRDIGANPVARSNIAYAVHCYPNSYQPWDYYWGYLKASYPLIVTEWGYPTSQGTRSDYGIPILNYMSSKQISWTAWCFHTTWGPNMLQNWDYVPTDFGSLIKSNL